MKNVLSTKMLAGDNCSCYASKLYLTITGISIPSLKLYSVFLLNFNTLQVYRLILKLRFYGCCHPCSNNFIYYNAMLKVF